MSKSEVEKAVKRYNDKKYCCVCARQIVSYKISNKLAVGGSPSTNMGFGKQCCCECSEDLDENGLFPEERRS